MALTYFDRLAAQFPDPESAPPDGPVAYGGNLSPAFLLAAYSRGIFPWYGKGYPILWHSPDPRAILPLKDFHLPKRSARAIAHKNFHITLDRCFPKVMKFCGNLREDTWITPGMLKGYIKLHRLGYAHSIEAWRDNKLVGGLYGVSIGRVFCGESMFHLESEASRASLAALVQLLRQLDFLMLDIQQESPHMMAMGATLIPRSEYLERLSKALKNSPSNRLNLPCPWPPLLKKFEFSENLWKEVNDLPHNS